MAILVIIKQELLSPENNLAFKLKNFLNPHNMSKEENRRVLIEEILALIESRDLQMTPKSQSVQASPKRAQKQRSCWRNASPRVRCQSETSLHK